jgi:NAD(P)-dependent dehydrogenase (short-subunit alcohol dehydrogenase family)
METEDLMKTMTWSGAVSLVTGAGSGIGRAVAQAFADEGLRVVVADIDEKEGQGTVRQIREAGGEALFLLCDVSREEMVKSTVEAAVKEWGRIDYACNNAGIHNAFPGPLVDLDRDQWDRILSVNLTGVFLCMKHEIQQMVNQGVGVIVNVASAAGLVAEPGSPAYTAAKHGVMGLTKVAALDCIHDGIRINAVCPACVDTPMLASAPEEVRQYLRSLHPIGRFGKPEEVAAAVLYLCSDLAGFTTGTGIVLDGGALAL